MKTLNISCMENRGEIIIYKTGDKETQIEVRFEAETVWLTQRQMAELFGTEVPAISKHIKNIYGTGELKTNSTLSKMETVQKRSVDYIIEVLMIVLTKLKIKTDKNHKSNVYE